MSQAICLIQLEIVPFTPLTTFGLDWFFFPQCIEFDGIAWIYIEEAFKAPTLLCPSKQEHYSQF